MAAAMVTRLTGKWAHWQLMDTRWQMEKEEDALSAIRDFRWKITSY